MKILLKFVGSAILMLLSLTAFAQWEVYDDFNNERLESSKWGVSNYSSRSTERYGVLNMNLDRNGTAHLTSRPLNHIIKGIKVRLWMAPGCAQDDTQTWFYVYYHGLKLNGRQVRVLNNIYFDANKNSHGHYMYANNPDTVIDPRVSLHDGYSERDRNNLYTGRYMTLELNIPTATNVQATTNWTDQVVEINNPRYQYISYYESLNYSNGRGFTITGYKSGGTGYCQILLDQVEVRR